MNFDKISVTLYDLIGYLLPGYVLLIAGAIAEASFFGSRLLTLAGIVANPLPYSVFAYFLGHFCHAIGSALKDWSVHHARRVNIRVAALPANSYQAYWLRRWSALVRPVGAQLCPKLSQQVEKELESAYDLRSDQLDENKSLNVYLLCDSFVLAMGGSAEREVLQAREGFYKASTAAFTLLGTVFLLSLLMGGATVNRTTEVSEWMTWRISALLWFICWIAAVVAWGRHAFFSHLKKNHVKLLFLAMRSVKKSNSTP